MATDTIPATLGFLTDAAHLLASAAPETSAYIMSQRNSLMFENELGQSDVQRQHFCGCCGHIMIAGHGDELKIESSQSRNKKRRVGNKQRKKGSVSPNAGCRKTWTCGMCGRYTTIGLPPPAHAPRRRLKPTLRPSSTKTTGVIETTSVASKAASSQIAITSSSANASSKKRAKNRKQGLQALLQQSSNSKPQSGLGLSLADFMQN